MIYHIMASLVHVLIDGLTREIPASTSHSQIVLSVVISLAITVGIFSLGIAGSPLLIGMVASLRRQC